jgi:tetratricopeptide (TPR) repeat protein
MPINERTNYTFKELIMLQQEWINKDEAEEDPDFRQEWVEEGIHIHRQLLKHRLSAEEKERYYRLLADLYLEYGRSEKLINGNYRTAFRYLQRAAQCLPQKGDTFYHLAFLAEAMTNGQEKWESAAFYAKEALERGLETEKQIKILCLLGKAYLELGFSKDAADCFSRSKKLDKDDDYSRFRMNYSKKKTNENSFFSRLGETGGKTSKRALREELLEQASLGKCFVLEITRRGSILYGNNASMALTQRQFELIKLFFSFKGAFTKEDILHNTTGLGIRKPEAIKTDISRLRAAIKNELGVDGKQLIQTINEEGKNKYIWNPKIETHIIE